MKTVQFIFGVHNHQPVGNFDFVFEEAFRKSYLPMVELLEQFPNIATVLHFSGCLLEWLEQAHPDYVDRIRKLAERGNIEIIASGFYEPVLSAISERDRQGQIRKMDHYIRDRFHYQAEGLWLTERVWEPHLAKSIVDAGIQYLAVDDYHFLASGMEQSALTGYFNTDEEGRVLGLFPINQKLRYTIPYADHQEVLDYLQSFATESGENVIVMIDDGEKFGVWPGSHALCWKRRWMERFFTLLEENQATIRTTTLKNYFHRHRPRGRVYLPTISYFEMSEWTLPADQGETFHQLVREYSDHDRWPGIKPFIRGGMWRNFQQLYDESNWMQKRVLTTSDRLNRALKEGIEFPELEIIQDYIWRAQCNCAYWHGIFGGLYLPHLRHAIFQELLAAEIRMDQTLGRDTLGFDLDNDGAVEFRLNSDLINAIFSERGGVLKELDYRPAKFNLLNSMRRYGESYHSRVAGARLNTVENGSIHEQLVAKEKGLEQFLAVDPFPRSAFLDHFFSEKIPLREVKKVFPEQGNFHSRIFQVEKSDHLHFSAHGMAFGKKVGLAKTIVLTENCLQVQVNINNEDQDPLKGWYGIEINISLLGGHTRDRYYEIDGKQPRRFYLDSDGSEKKVNSVALVNEWDQFRVTVEFPVTSLWRFPVETVTMSESGLERIYQSSVLIPHWKLNLKPGESFQATVELKVEPLS
jgi:alpha-amylase